MRRRMLAVLALTLLAGTAVRGQTAEGTGAREATALASELERLNETLSGIKALLERVTETQGLDLLLKRMELSSAQVTETEKRLRNAESERASVEDDRDRVEMNVRGFEAELASGSFEASAEQIAAITAQHETAKERLEARLRSLDDEIAELRNLLGAKRRELEDWQGYVDRRLGGV